MKYKLFRAQWIGCQTLIHKEIARFFRIWVQTLLPPVITMSLYFIIFGSFIGRRIGTVSGVPYMQFIAPGLIMMSVITNSYGNVVTSFYSSRFLRSVDEMLISPMSSWMILLGYVIGGIARGILVGFLVTGVALLFTDLQMHHILITLLTLLLTSLLFSLAGFSNAIYAKSFDDISTIPTFVLTPLTYLGGVFFSVSLLPSFWKNLSMFNPILYMVSSFRYGILGIADTHIGASLAVIGTFIILFILLNLYLLEKGVGLRT